jgi:hypothetical protein
VGGGGGGGHPNHPQHNTLLKKKKKNEGGYIKKLRCKEQHPKCIKVNINSYFKRISAS